MSSGPGAGRFAPSPTGPLHLGSLLAATASFLDARQHGIPWQLRLDDLDTPRNAPGADSLILTSLEQHGLHWDGPVTRQSDDGERYAAAIAELGRRGSVFYCRCSRSELRDSVAYPGTCRHATEPRPDSALRVRVDDAVITFEDLVQGPQSVVLATIGGDFVIRRRDGIVAYQLATAVDDGAPGISRVIRGRDLLGTTPRQIFLMQHLGLSVPEYGHIPVLRNEAGQKLSKQTHAPAVDDDAAAANLTTVLTLLDVAPAPGAAAEGCAALLAQAIPRFAATRLRGRGDFAGAATHSE